MNGLQWFQVIVSYTIQASLVIAIAWGVERSTTSAATKARVWSMCFLSLLILLAMGVLLPRLDCIHPWSSLGPNELLNVASTEYVLGTSLLAIWACGAGVMIARWIIHFFIVRRFIGNCPEYSSQIQKRLGSLIPSDLTPPHEHQLSFRESPQELGPFCYQFHYPLVFLPRVLVNGDETELVHVLRHELTHLKTCHPMQLFIQKMAEVVLWFHPLMWACGRRSSLVREFVCDDAASGDARETASYLRTLLRIVESRASSPRGSLTFGRSPSQLQTRARRLVQEKPPTTVRFPWAPALVCILAILISQLWMPTNPLASHYSRFSPWPSWTSTVGHAFGINLRDFESFDAELRTDELLEELGQLPHD